ncbi:MAG: DNA translocase FtsK 4TM domain-containing protein, partial [Pseudomonadota bacterium]
MPKINLDPDIKRGIFIVFILAAGAISFLSLFNLAGVLGFYLAKGMLLFFGWGKWLPPFILLALGFLLYHEDKDWVRGATYFGIFLFIISFQALLHLLVAFVPDPSYIVGVPDVIGNVTETKIWSESVDLGFGGGYIGLFLASGFIKILGLWASFIVVFCLILISLMLIFNTTLTRLVGRESWLARLIYHPIIFITTKLFRRGGKDEEREEYGENEIIEEELKEEASGANEAGIFKSKKIKEEPEFMRAEKGGEKAGRIRGKTGFKRSNVKIDLPLDFLSEKGGKPLSGDIKGSTEIIKRTLENFGIPVEMGEVSVGPTVTQYTFKPAEGIKLS